LGQRVHQLPNIVSEMALAHKASDKVEAAYRRGELLEKRRRLMEAWAAFATSDPTKAGNKVVPMREVPSRGWWELRVA
jgi:hypothetical protein